MNREGLSAEQTQVLDGLVRNLARAAELGLIPQDGMKVSERGQFIINPDNITEAEDKRMRSYRHKEYPKAMRRWAADGACEEREVATKAEEDALVAEGWTEEAVPPAAEAAHQDDDAPARVSHGRRKK